MLEYAVMHDDEAEAARLRAELPPSLLRAFAYAEATAAALCASAIAKAFADKMAVKTADKTAVKMADKYEIGGEGVARRFAAVFVKKAKPIDN